MKVLNNFLRIITVASLIVYSLFFNLLGGAGITAGAISNHRDGIVSGGAYSFYLTAGIVMIISSVLMTSATVLLFGKKYFAAAVTEAAGTLCFLTVTVIIIVNAGKLGITDQTLRPYSAVYASRHLPALIHSAAVAALTVPVIIQKKRDERQALRDYVLEKSGVNEIMNLPYDDFNDTAEDIQEGTEL